MITFKLLNISEFYGESELIEVAKGKHKLPETLKESYKLYKREILCQLKK